MKPATIAASNNSAPKTLRANPDWAKLLLFDRKGWRRLAFGELAENTRDSVMPTPADSAAYIGLEHMDPGSLHVRRWGSQADLIGQKLRMRKGDILFARRNAYLRRVAIAPHDGLFSAHGMILRAKSDIVLPEFLPFLMMGDNFMNRAEKISVGSLSPTINWTTLKDEEFDVPPLDQQRRIAVILLAVDEVVENWRATKLYLEQVRTAKLKAMMLGTTNGNERQLRDIGDFSPTRRWRIQRAEELVASPITKGATPSPYLNTKKATVPFLKIYNLTFTGALDFTINPTYVEPEVHQTDLKRSRVRPGDVLMNLVGPPLGKTALVPADFPEANVNQAIAIYRIEDPMMREFFAMYLRSDLAQRWLEKRSKKTSGQRNLTLELAQQLPVPIPPAEVLSEVVKAARNFAVAHHAVDVVLKEVFALGQFLTNKL